MYPVVEIERLPFRTVQRAGKPYPPGGQHDAETSRKKNVETVFHTSMSSPLTATPGRGDTP